VKDASGELQGVAVDVLQELGRRLGVPVKYVMYETPGKVADDASNDKWDASVLAIEPTRAATIAFSPPMTEIHATYLVRADSRFTKVTELDSPGTRIAVNEKAGYDLYLTREIRHATLLRAPSSPAVVDHFIQEKADVAANVKQQLEIDAKRLGGLRLLPGRFMVIQQAMGCQRSRGTEAATQLARFVEEMKSSGFVAEALARHKVEGASVAPAA